MDPVVIEYTVQEADNGYVVVARQSGIQIGLSVLANEVEVAAHVANVTLSKAKSPKSKQTDVDAIGASAAPAPVVLG